MYICPECGALILHLTCIGDCPVCGAKLAARYIGVRACGEWVLTPTEPEGFRDAVMDPDIVSIYSLEWY